jgi:hypothetical protein
LQQHLFFRKNFSILITPCPLGSNYLWKLMKLLCIFHKRELDTFLLKKYWRKIELSWIGIVQVGYRSSNQNEIKLKNTTTIFFTFKMNYDELSPKLTGDTLASSSQLWDAVCSNSKKCYQNLLRTAIFFFFFFAVKAILSVLN